ncbi:MAG: S-layer homology domain-containing protein, partial [Chloroflexia bacterium]
MAVLAMLVLLGGIAVGTRPQAGTLSTATVGSSKHAVAALNSNQAASAIKGAGQASTAGYPLHSTVIHSDRNDVSPPLRSLPVTAPIPARKEIQEPSHAHGSSSPSGSGQQDPVVQSSFGPLVMPTPMLVIEGVSNINGGYPSDSTGDVGPDNYVQWVNTSLQIWNKNGTSLLGPVNGNTIWAGFGGQCQADNAGDPIVQYDQLANRWMISQFAAINFPNGPFYQCIAVSTSPDPTGTWNRYGFQTSATLLNDYPHFGVWPDAYYMTAHLFLAPGFSWAGQGAYAFDRAKMLLGQPATMQLVELPATDWGGMLPSDLEGNVLPPAGAPNTFAEVTDADWDPPNTTADELQLHNFHVDWTNPANSTFSAAVHVPTAAFDGTACSGFDRDCVPQQGTAIKLDAISDRLMYRLSYRNFGDHESLVVNHTVDANSSDTGYTGIRWLEVRNPRGAAPTVYQQGTYAPDAKSRFMGSAAMDRDGNIAIGYSVSSSTMYPAIAYAGRLASDPLGQLSQGEVTMFAGTGAQTGPENRWGDYTTLSVDPSDGCTFWYTNEYVQTTGAVSWRTKVGSFKFPSCGQSTPTPTVTATPPPALTSTPTATAVTTPCSITFTDVHSTDYFYDPVTYLYCHGAISGYADNTFRPGNLTTRGQLSKIVVLAEGWPTYTPPNPTFTDVPESNAFYSYIETAYHHDIISGYT